MNRFIPLALIPATLIAGIAAAGTLQTEMTDAQEAQAAQASGMTLNAAIDTAQGKTGGTAISAGWEDDDNGHWGYEVEIADASNSIETWFVNPADGTVTKVMETQDDHEQEGDHEDGEQDDD